MLKTFIPHRLDDIFGKEVPEVLLIGNPLFQDNVADSTGLMTYDLWGEVLVRVETASYKREDSSLTDYHLDMNGLLVIETRSLRLY